MSEESSDTGKVKIQKKKSLKKTFRNRYWDLYTPLV